MSAPRNVRSEATSYEQTGIPCGNPVRYSSRGVIRMSRGDEAPYEDQRLGVPGQGTESEAEQQLKRMVEKQLDTNVTLEGQKGKLKQFTSASTFTPFRPKTRGALSLTAYQSLEEQNEYVARLRQYGLTADEIQYKLEIEGLVPKPTKRSRFGANPEAEVERLRQLKKKIEEKERALAKPDSFTNVQVLSRHAMEVEMSLNKGTERANEFKHLVQASKTVSDPNDPVLQTLISKAELLGKAGLSIPEIAQRQNYGKTKPTSRDHIEDPPTRENLNADTSGQKDTVKSPRLPDNIVPVGEEEILQNKVSTEQIKEIPKFKDYKPGEPNKTLFLKNLSPKVTEEDLVALFIGFQQENCPKLVFRLMKGRMRGQAFVTFPDEATSTRALHLVNGYLLKGKPLIVQFGKKTREECETHKK